LYAYTSGAATNGSAFAGLSANTPFYNLTLAAAMFAGRFIVIIPVLCIAGSLAAKRSGLALSLSVRYRNGCKRNWTALVSLGGYLLVSTSAVRLSAKMHLA